MLGYRIGFIGAGNMASAILSGGLRRSILQPEKVYLFDPCLEKAEAFGAKGVHVAASNQEVADAVDILVLAVKPQMFDQVLPELEGHVTGKCVVSIAAGISVSYLKERLSGCGIIRVMPNTPMMIGKGMSALAEAPEVDAAYFDAVNELFSAAGQTVVVKEELINAVIATSGSSPAYFFRMASAMVAQAAELGLDEDTALQLTAATMEGAAGMLLKSGRTAAELTRQVCSPGGTTLAALTAFDEYGLDQMVAESMKRCVKRAEELGQ